MAAVLKKPAHIYLVMVYNLKRAVANFWGNYLFNI